MEEIKIGDYVRCEGRVMRVFEQRLLSGRMATWGEIKIERHSTALERVGCLSRFPLEVLHRVELEPCSRTLKEQFEEALGPPIAPAPAPPVQRIDGLTPHQCFQAFEAAQQEKRTFELELPVYAALQSPCELWCDTEYRRVQHVSDLGAEMRVEFTDGSAARYPRNMRRPVRRSTTLTPAQLAAAREIWGRLLRHDVGVSKSRAAEQAPSVTIVNEDLEIEALAADVP